MSRTKLPKYLHQFIGKAIGTGGNVFENVEELTITDEMINGFKTVRHGIDFGFAVDAFAYIQGTYDSKYNNMYLFDEVYQIKLTNETAAEKIKPKLNGMHIPLLWQTVLTRKVL